MKLQAGSPQPGHEMGVVVFKLKSSRFCPFEGTDINNFAKPGQVRVTRR